MVKVRTRKVQQFSINEFWKNISCLISAPNFGLGGSKLWDKDEKQNIRGKKRKRNSIRLKVYLLIMPYVRVQRACYQCHLDTKHVLRLCYHSHTETLHILRACYHHNLVS